MLKRFLMALCVAPAMLFTLPAQAGHDITRSAPGVGRCFDETNPDFNLNITHCQGTMAGIRNQSSDSGRFAYFSLGSNGSLSFTMVVNGRGYSCSAPSSMAEIWRTAASTNGWFAIAFDRTTGVCMGLTVTGGSHMKIAL